VSPKTSPNARLAAGGCSVPVITMTNTANPTAKALATACQMCPQSTVSSDGAARSKRQQRLPTAMPTR